MDLSKLSVGVEVEFFFLDPQTGEISDVDPSKIIAEADSVVRQSGWGRVELESKVCMGEIVTGIAHTPTQLKRMLDGLKATVEQISLREGLIARFIAVPPILPAGAAVRDVTQGKLSYVNNQIEYGRAQERKFCAATHIHAGTLTNDESRVFLANRMRPFLPVFAGLAAGSPFDGVSHGPIDAASWRLNLLRGTPGHEVPDVFRSYAEYKSSTIARIASGEISSEAAVWSYIRPAALHSTVELRVLDSIDDVDLITSIAAIYISLVGALLSEAQTTERYIDSCQDRSSNRIADDISKAAQFGVNAKVFDPFSGRPQLISDILPTLLSFIRTTAELAGWAQEIDRVHEIMQMGEPASKLTMEFLVQKTAKMQDGMESRDASKLAMIDIATRENSQAPLLNSHEDKN